MPSRDVMHKFASGTLHSGSKSGPKVRSRQQAIAIMMSEERNEKKHGGRYESKREERAEKPSIGREIGRALKRKR